MTAPRRRADDQWARWDKRVRDLVLFAVGIAGIVNELFLSDEPNPTALVFLATIVGVPFVLRADEKRRSDQATTDEEEAPK